MPQQTEIETKFRFKVLGSPFLEDALFEAAEVDSSRDITGIFAEVIYDVFLVTPTTDGKTFLESGDFNITERPVYNNEEINDELIIAANTWQFAGWRHHDKALIKQWPPKCISDPNKPNHWRVTIRYAPLFIVDFQTTPVRVKKFVSVETIGWERAANKVLVSKNIGGLEPLLKTAWHSINVDKKGVVHGVDELEPSLTWTERWNWGPLQSLNRLGYPVEEGYQKTLAESTGTVNYIKFRGFPAECVKMLGAIGRSGGAMGLNIDYKFSYKPEREVIDLGGESLQLPKSWRGGWNIIDFEIHPFDGDDFTPRATVHRVKLHKAPSTDFRDLEIIDDLPFGYGTPLDGNYYPIDVNIDTDRIGTKWNLPEWGVKQ